MSSGLPGRVPSTPEARPPVRVEGRRVVLREKRVEDARDDYEWRTDPDLAIYDAVPPLRMAWEDFFRIYRDELRRPPPRQEVLAIEDPETGLHIGNCMYYDLDETRGQAEFGIMIGRREFWSQGYGRDAVAAMLRYIFHTRKVNRVYLHTLTWNVRAQKAFQSAGFSPVREVLRNGHTFLQMEIFREQVFPPEEQQASATGQRTAGPAGVSGSAPNSPANGA